MSPLRDGQLTRKSAMGKEPEQEQSMDWHVPWHAHVPGGLMIAGMVLAWIPYAFDPMLSWGISARALADGRFQTIALHMFAHGGLLHILMNMSAMASISGPLVSRLGQPPIAWLKFVVIFVLSGLAGMSVYLMLHPGGTVPMLGASGAIYGLIGLLIRIGPVGEEPVPIISPQSRKAAVEFVKENLFLFVMLTLPSLLAGRAGAVAWEAHLGGILFGFLVGHRFVPIAPADEIAGQDLVKTRTS